MSIQPENLTQGGPENVLIGQSEPAPTLAAASLPGPGKDVTHRSYTPGTQGKETVRNELVLIERILAGEKELFMELVRPYQKVVFSMAVSMVKCDDAAEDVSQEALFKAFKNLSQFRGECKFSTWIIQIALNEARHRIRKSNGRPKIPWIAVSRMKKEITFRSIWQIGARFRRKLCNERNFVTRCTRRSLKLKPIYR